MHAANVGILSKWCPFDGPTRCACAGPSSIQQHETYTKTSLEYMDNGPLGEYVLEQFFSGIKWVRCTQKWFRSIWLDVFCYRSTHYIHLAFDQSHVEAATAKRSALKWCMCVLCCESWRQAVTVRRYHWLPQRTHQYKQQLSANESCWHITYWIFLGVWCHSFAYT